MQDVCSSERPGRIVSAHLPPDLAEPLLRKAQAEDLTVSQLIRRAIRQVYGGEGESREGERV